LEKRRQKWREIEDKRENGKVRDRCRSGKRETERWFFLETL